MSCVSDYKCGALSYEEFKSLARKEYDDRYPDFPDEPTRYCHECEFCKHAKRFVREIVTREADGEQVLKTTDRYCYMDICVKDIENIREINSWDEVCEEHGELFDMED